MLLVDEAAVLVGEADADAAGEAGDAGEVGGSGDGLFGLEGDGDEAGVPAEEEDECAHAQQRENDEEELIG